MIRGPVAFTYSGRPKFWRVTLLQPYRQLRASFREIATSLPPLSGSDAALGTVLWHYNEAVSNGNGRLATGRRPGQGDGRSVRRSWPGQPDERSKSMSIPYMNEHIRDAIQTILFSL